MSFPMSIRSASILRGRRHDRASALHAPSSRRQSCLPDRPPPLLWSPRRPARQPWTCSARRPADRALYFLVEARSPWEIAVPHGAALAPVVLPRAQHVIAYHAVDRRRVLRPDRRGPRGRIETGVRARVSAAETPMSCPSARPGRRPGRGRSPRLHQEDVRRPASLRRRRGRWRPGVAPSRVRLRAATGPSTPCSARCPTSSTFGPLGCRPATRCASSSISPSRSRGSGAPGVNASGPAERADVRRGSATSGRAVRRLASGWRAGLRDDIVGRALGLLHERPVHPWTLHGLAREVGLSRSALAITNLATSWALSPMQYLTLVMLQLTRHSAWPMATAQGLRGGARRRPRFRGGVQPRVSRRAAGGPAGR